MTFRFALDGVEGEVSERPDWAEGLPPRGDFNGITFVEFGYSRPGRSRQCVSGLQMGLYLPDQDAKVTLDGTGANGEISAPSFVFRPPGDIGRTAWTGPFEGTFLTMTQEAVERITHTPFSRIVATPVVCDLGERMKVFHLLAALAHGAEDGEQADPLLVESITLAVLRASGGLADEEWRRSPTLSKEQAGRLRRLIADRIAEPMSIGTLAEAAGLSESYFVRAFKGSFGLTPYQYVLRERVALAQALIRTGKVSLSEAAARSGFPDARRMGRTFRQITGHSPTGSTRAAKD